MSNAPFSPRPTCTRCLRALSACWCDARIPFNSRAELVLLQHPRESRNPIGTARMAHLGVAKSALHIGIHFEDDPAIVALLNDSSRHNVVLYPAPSARPAEELRDLQQPLRIFVLDGTWWQAKKLWQKNPWLQRLPAYRLTPSAPGLYRIRREPAAHCLATIEAVAQLLDVLGGQQGQHAPLLDPFFAMVEKQLAYVESARRTPRVRVRTRPQRIGAPLKELSASLPRLLLIHAEGNGWPAKRTGDIELMQWLAIRPSTGETFHALIQTRTRAPNALYQQGLTASDLATAIPKAEFLARWAAFAQPNDAWCTWGHFAESLLKQCGGAAASTINLHQVCSAWFRRRMQHVEDALEALGSPVATPAFPGRGGRRMAQMAATVSALFV